MVEITNYEQLSDWVRTRSHADAILIATMSALRVVPLSSKMVLRGTEQSRNEIFLTILRTNFISYSIVSRGSRGDLLTLRRAAEAADRLPYPGYENGDRVAEYTYMLARAGFTAVGLAAKGFAHSDFSTPTRVVHGGVANAVDAAREFVPKSEGILRATSHDVAALERGRRIEDIARSALWPQDAPQWFGDHWHALRDHLLATDEGWEVWTDWYQDRLDGKPANEELELAKALIPNEIWEAGPKTLNAEIARLIAEHDTPTQRRPKKTDADPARKSQGTQRLLSSRSLIAVQTADLQDRIAAEIVAQTERRSNDPIAAENIEFLESLQTNVEKLSDAVDALPSRPAADDAEATTERAWTLRNKIEEYAGWIAGEEHARQIANGTLLGGMVTLLISFGWSPLPLTAAAVALVGGPKLKAHLSDLIKQMKGG